MHLPLDFTRSIEVALDDLPDKKWQDDFLGEAANQMNLRNARAVRIQDDRLEFLGPDALFSSNHNLLTPITSGWIELDVSGGAITIRYGLSFRRVLWFLMAVPVPVVPLFIANRVPVTFALAAMACAWFWVLIMNVVFRLWYFGRLMSKVVDSLWR
jgi:hypothetical protein